MTRVKLGFRMAGIGDSRGWEWIREGLLPQPIKTGPNSTAFVNSDLIALGELWVRGHRWMRAAAKRREA